jgi:hypothetical protein
VQARGERLRWNARGPIGPAGLTGAPGEAGRQGETGPQGSSASSMLTGNTGSIPANVGVTHYLHPSGISDYWTAPTFADMLSPNTPVIAQDLAVSLPNPPGAAGESYTATLHVNAADTALTCAITGTVETSCGNSTARVAIPARSLISLEVAVTAGSVSRRVRFGWRATAAP